MSRAMVLDCSFSDGRACPRNGTHLDRCDNCVPRRACCSHAEDRRRPQGVLGEGLLGQPHRPRRDGRLQPPAVDLPGRADRPLHRRADPLLARPRALRAGRPPGPLPERHRDDAERGAARGPRLLDHRRHHRHGRQPVGRHRVLGRARHRVLPHLRAALPHVGAPEAVRARDARPGPDLLRRHGRGARAAVAAVRPPRRPPVRPQRPRHALHDHARRRPGHQLRRARDDLPHRAEHRRRPGTASGRARSAPPSRSASSTTASRSTSRTSRRSPACARRSSSS